MKNYGKIIEYDGYCGTILSVDGKECLALKKNFCYDDVKENDIVTFIIEKKEEKLVAYFIKKLEN